MAPSLIVGMAGPERPFRVEKVVQRSGGEKTRHMRQRETRAKTREQLE